MDRRQFLALVGVSVIAGCTGGEEDGEPADEPVDDDEDTPDEEGTDDEATETEEEEPEQDEDDEEKSEEEEEDEENEEADADSWDYVDEAGEQVQLPYGEMAALSNGVEVIIHGIEEVSAEIAGETPDEREAFAVVTVEAANEGDEEARLPDPIGPDFELLYEDDQVGTAFRSAIWRETDYEEYEGGDVQPGVRREGQILFEVSNSDLTQADIDTLWQVSLPPEELAGEVDVRWIDG